MFKGFKEFLLRGNVVDLAVAVVIGAAFNTIVDKFVSALINPIIGMVFKADSLDGALQVALPGGGTLAFGAVIGALINFLIVAAVVYFVFVLPMNKLRDRNRDTEPEEPAGETEQELLAEIRDLIRAQQAAPQAASIQDSAPSSAAAPSAAAPPAATGDDAARGSHGAHGA